MELGIKDKTRVSKALEEKVFDGALKKRELEALYRRCTSYQTEAPEPWSGDLYRPYSKYFGFLSSLKVRACLNELSHYGYLDRWKKKSIEVFDFGAGTLGASLGVVDFATATKLSIEKLTTIDVDLKPMQWAAKYFEDFLEPSPEFKTSLSSPSRDKASLLVAVDVLNEQDAFRNRSFDDPSMKFLKDWISEMNEDSIFLWIEPANKKTNQNFQYIPFCKLIQKIKYKAELVGIEVVLTEEAYTSKASFLDRDPLPKYEKNVYHTFSGKRIKRGLYQASDNRIINADVNGSANIGRKVIENEDILLKLDRSVAATPERINPLKFFCV
jgi:hypothetical protein